MDRDYYRSWRGPSFFFPILLITAGVVWLLVNNGNIPIDNLIRLSAFWPVLLICGGLSLLVRRIWWPLSALIWAGLAVLTVWLLTTGSAFLPNLPAVELKHQVLSEPVGAATSATVRLNLSINSTTIHAAQDTNTLVKADLYALDTMRLDASGNTQKEVQLRNSGGGQSIYWWRFDQVVRSGSQPWDIGLNPNVPMALAVDESTGHTTLDLSGLKLTSLDLQASTGSTEIKLPEGRNLSPLKLHASTGGMVISVPENTPADMNVNASTGGITIRVPQGAGVQVNVTNGGTGGLHVPAGYKKVSGESNQKEGVYQNDAFATAKTPIKITVDMSTGGFTVQ